MIEANEVLKPEEAQPNTGADPAGTEPPAKTGDDAKEEKAETAAELAARLARAEQELEITKRDRDNYKQGLLADKAKKTVLSPELVQPEYPPQTVAQPYYQPPQPQPKDEDEEDDLSNLSTRKLEKMVEEKARKIIDTRDRDNVLRNEQVAIKKWMQVHPELIDDALRGQVVEEYANKNGKSVDGIVLDLERAYKMFKLERGYKVDEPLNAPDNSQQIKQSLAQLPGGAGKSESRPTGFNDFEVQVMNQYNITPELFNQWKQKVLKGEMSVPDNVYEKLLQ